MSSHLGDWVVGIVCALLLVWLLTPESRAEGWRHHYMTATPAGVMEGGWLLFSLHDKQGKETGMMISKWNGENVRVWAIKPDCKPEGYNLQFIGKEAIDKLTWYCKD